jgi:lysophospholipase
MNSTVFDRRAHPAGAAFSSWQAPDGWNIRRLDWPQPAQARIRGSLLFAGGRSDFIEKYLEPLAHWHGAGWNVTSFDWRGQGESRGDILGGHLDSFDGLVADGAVLIDAWLAATPGPHAVVAHPMGGHLMLRILAERRPAIDAAVLVAPMIGINARPIPDVVGRWTARTLSALGLSRVRAWRQNERPHLPGSSRQAYLTSCADRYSDEAWWHSRQPGFQLGPPSWGWLNAAYQSIHGLTADKLRSLSIPFLVLGTDRDRLVSPTAIRRAARLLPKAELHMFPRAAHELLRESDPVRTEALARIDAFLDEHAR